MFTVSKKSGKFIKRKTGIMKVFTDTIRNLNDLQTQTRKEIEAQDKIIEAEIKEKDALVQEEKDTDKIIGRMNNIIGKDEEPEVKSETVEASN